MNLNSIITVLDDNIGGSFTGDLTEVAIVYKNMFSVSVKFHETPGIKTSMWQTAIGIQAFIHTIGPNIAYTLFHDVVKNLYNDLFAIESQKSFNVTSSTQNNAGNKNVKYVGKIIQMFSKIHNI